MKHPQFPCPFCGCTTIMWICEGIPSARIYRVACQNCGAHGPSVQKCPTEHEFATSNRALEKWEERV